LYENFETKPEEEQAYLKRRVLAADAMPQKKARSS